MTRGDAVAACKRVLADKSKSFALASRLLPPGVRDEVAVVYAFCRRVDDAIDLAPRAARPEALAALRAEVDAVYAGDALDDVTLAAFAEVVRARGVPRAYVDALLDGMEMDVDRRDYPTSDALHLYAWRVAGVVGLALCHVMGVADPRALRHAAHLGLAMQLTNICRDVDEDLRDGRVYLPRTRLGFALTAVPARGSPERAAVSRAVEATLDEADRLYRSADLGLAALPLRCALAVRAARNVYAAIGDRLRARGCDPFEGRVVVPGVVKAWLVLRAIASTALDAPRRARGPFVAPARVLEFPRDVLASTGGAP